MSNSVISQPPPLELAVGKVFRRLLPFLLLMYVLAFLDRANIGFAKKAFQLDTGIGDAAFALGAGIFFIGYALFEIPSNLIMHKVGARVWMCRIMVTWGLVSAALAFAHNETTFYVLRFLLGVAEAGFFPGVILYLTYWFPARVRGRMMGVFYFGAPIAFIAGSPLSGLLLELHGFGGLLGWQWMFLVEGLMASVVGVWAFWFLSNRPVDANWLSDAEKAALVHAIDSEESHKHAHGPRGAVAAMSNPRLLYMCSIYFLIQMSVYGVVFYLPSQVAGLLGKKVGFEVGLVTAIPWVCALAAAYLVPRYAERVDAHRGVAAVTLAAAGLGIALSAMAGTPLLALLALCVAAAGFIAVQPLFWTFPTNYLGGRRRCRGAGFGQFPGGLGRLCRSQRQDLGGKLFRLAGGGSSRAGRDHLVRRRVDLGPEGPGADPQPSRGDPGRGGLFFAKRTINKGLSS